MMLRFKGLMSFFAKCIDDVQSKLPQSLLFKSLVGSAAVLGDENDSLG